MNSGVETYNDSQAANDKVICDRLAKMIDGNLPEAENKFGIGIRFGFWTAIRSSVTAS